MKSSSELDNYTNKQLQSYVQSFIDNKIEESINLDYKSGDSLKKDDKGKKKELCKDVSAFANSNGGLIIYGIVEDGHIPKDYHYVNGGEINKEWIENVINTGIQRKIEGLRIYPVRFEDDPLKTVYLVNIPESDNAPHMYSDKRYYERQNFQSVPMEEYRVRNLYHKAQKSILDIDFPSLSHNLGSMKKETPREIESGGFFMFIRISNIGRVVEKDYKMEVIIPIELTPQREMKMWERDSRFKTKFLGKEKRTLSALGNNTIFPDEIHPVGNFFFQVSNPESQANCIITIRLYYGGGKKVLHLFLKDIFTRSYKPIPVIPRPNK